MTIQHAATHLHSRQGDEAHTDMSVILVAWNNKDYLEPCLRSLYQEDTRTSFDVVVVDNGSTDGSQAMLGEMFPQVKLIQNEYNVGLGKASNQGIAATGGRYVLLLNNDTVVNGRSLDALIDFLDATQNAGAVGGRLLNPDGSFQAGYSSFPGLAWEFLVATGFWSLLSRIRPSGNAPEPKKVDWAGSACLLLRRSALAEVGLLDEEYFIYGDEADLQYRLARAGWSVYYLPSADTIHYGGRSMDRWRRRKMVYRGKMLFYKKNYGPARAMALRVMLGVLSLGKILIWTVTSVSPKLRIRAGRELRSNLDVVALCFRLK